jgi:hypothetical protein
MRSGFFLLISVALGGAGCKLPPPPGAAPQRDSTRVRPVPPAPPRAVVVRDTALEQRAARLELTVLEKEAEVEELRARLDDARREVVRAMAKLQSLATRAEAASGMAEAEIAIQSLRTAGGSGATVPELGQSAQLLQLASGEFDRQNYGGALYLSTQAKNVAAAGQSRLVGNGGGSRGTSRAGEVPFAVPLKIQTTGRANVREGPGSGFNVLFTLEPGSPLVAYSYVDQWVRVTDSTDRPGWIHQGLVGRRQ